MHSWHWYPINDTFLYPCNDTFPPVDDKGNGTPALSKDLLVKGIHPPHSDLRFLTKGCTQGTYTLNNNDDGAFVWFVAFPKTPPVWDNLSRKAGDGQLLPRADGALAQPGRRSGARLHHYQAPIVPMAAYGFSERPMDDNTNLIIMYPNPRLC